ncbi:glutathione S-transferase [Psychrosphaera saromensis]|uniref:glutathione transferase n=1 Tax=Psychrosphaera saromensis TaxID=716813 RepID=A0A2S7UVW4_9GAMM|nr:glutathione S-transferase [Psychrosphaera saromensis]PQJ53909.1 glutathione S-transferase [Psychrosphaera saromensis]GHB61446.1 glutathione S-transferase [Psychrosphaera saromensis]GLQ15287.1 glutathione S-transferase [Psychrosphaera saromensis]
MITLHHLNNSRSQRILWLLEELGLEYGIKQYQRDPVTSSAPESLKAIHPLGKSPVITDGDLTIAESGAIIEYLLDSYDTEKRLRSTKGQALLDYRYWLHFAEGSLMPLLVMKLVMMKMPKNPMPFFVKTIAKALSNKVQEMFISPRLTPQIELVENTLANRTWLTGEELSAADIQMSFPLQASATRMDLSAFPNIARYLKQIDALPAYQKAVERGGKLDTL